MLDNLLDIEVAYSLLKSGDGGSAKDPIDIHYEKLKTDIKVSDFCVNLYPIWNKNPFISDSLVFLFFQPMDKEDDEYKRLTDYVKLTHAATHNTYDLEVQEVICLIP